MRKLAIAAIAMISLTAPAYAVGTAFLSHSYVTGQTKICVYKFLGNEYHITVKAYEMCPRSIPV